MTTTASQKIEDFFSNFPRRSYSSGQIFIYPNEQVEYVYRIISGQVRQFDITRRGDEVVVGTFQTQSLFPMVFIAKNFDHDYFYQATTDTVMQIAPVVDIKDFLKQNSDVSYALLETMYTVADQLVERLKFFMKSSAREKVMLGILMECECDPTHQSSEHRVSLPGREFAARLGLTRETISREMHKLQNRGLVSVNNGTVYVASTQKLKEELARSVF